MERLKFCTKCKLNKPRTEFYKQTSRGDGLRTHCKECLHKWYLGHKGQQREKYVKRNFGVELDYIKHYVKEVDSCCDICKRQTKLVVDHNHKTGKFRGMLCTNCNSGLGHFRDEPGILRMAIFYLCIAEANGN